MTLAITRGEIRCLIGPNGAGKSTAFHLIAGRLAADGGSVLFEGRDIASLPAHERVRRGIGLKFQTTRIFPSFSVAENLAVAWRSDHGRDVLNWAVASFGLDRRLSQRADMLPHVEKQWLEICLALATGPRVVLLDEPTVGMTLEETLRTAEVIKGLAARGLSVLVVEHDMEFVRALGGRVTVMHQGAVFAEGSLHEIEAHADVRRIYLGER